MIGAMNHEHDRRLVLKCCDGSFVAVEATLDLTDDRLGQEIHNLRVDALRGF